jgi:putative PIN family toxin of toxin-antitoxin system
MTRVTVDTNVLISALVFQGLPGEFLALALAGSFQLIASPVLLDELDEKLRFKFLWSQPKASRVRNELEILCEVVSTINHLAVILDDPDDDRVLECATGRQSGLHRERRSPSA